MPDDWERGHTVPRHLGGKERRPECKACNREDGKKQTKIAAKMRRIVKKEGLKWDRTKKAADCSHKVSKPFAKGRKLRSRGFNKNLAKRYNRETGRWVTVKL